MKDFLTHVVAGETDANLIAYHPVAGGCINQAFKIQTTKGYLFLKCNHSDLLPMFEAERDGLLWLKTKSPLYTPTVIRVTTMLNRSYLLTTWIEKGTPRANFWEMFGRNLSQTHRQTQEYFGFSADNYIGSLAQSNREHERWPQFFAHERLEPQVKWAYNRGLTNKKTNSQFEILYKKLPELVPSEPPALLHGDLWSGNFMINAAGQAAVFDPSVHYGHRETELAFTYLFGGFDPTFYSHYELFYPLTPGFKDRIAIHNLYPLLVHANLFGASYLMEVHETLKRFC